MKKLLLLLLIPFNVWALDCYEASQVVGYSAVFHDDAGTVVDPTSPAATVRIIPFTGTATYTSLTAPAKLNTTTGWYGGEYTVGASPTYGLYEIYMTGTVPTSKTVGKIVERFQVRANCPDGVPQTGDSYARLGAPAGASVSADIAAVKSDTSSILVDTGTTLDTKINNIQGATFDTATDSLEAIRNRGDAAWTTGGGGSSSPSLLQNTTIATLSTQTNFTLTDGSSDNNAYKGHIIVITDQTTSTQKAVARIKSYTGSTKTISLEADPGIFTITAGDTVDIIATEMTWGATQSDNRAAGTMGRKQTDQR